MSKEILYSPQLLAALHIDLQKALDIDLDDGFFREYSLNHPWIKMGTTNLLKAVAMHADHKVFVKSFAPITRGYADAAVATLQELSTQNFEIPFLPIVGRSSGSLFFESGESNGNFSWNRLSNLDRNLFTEIVIKNGLQPLGSGDQIPLIKVNGINYLTDPFDDSPLYIHSFMKREQSNGLNT